MRSRTASKKKDNLLTDSTTAGEATFLILHSQFERFTEMAGRVLTTEDPEAVHQMRVATRRIRAAMDCLGNFMPKSLLALEPELRWLFHLLGDVRDLDVQLEMLQESESKSQAPGIGEVVARLRSERASKKAILIEQMCPDGTDISSPAHLENDRYAALVAQLKQAIGKGPAGSAISGTTVLAVAPDLIVYEGKQVKELGRKIFDSAPQEDYHKLRRAAKKFRYTLDFFDELYGEQAEQLIEKLKELQDLLGRRMDALFLCEKLGELAKDEGISKEGREAAKCAAQPFEKDANGKADEFKDAIGTLFGKKWKVLKQEMAERRRALWIKAR